MKRLVLFVVALVFAFCTVAVAEEPAATPTAAPTEKAAPVKAEKVKKHKKHHRHNKAKKAEKEEAPAAPADAPAK